MLSASKLRFSRTDGLGRPSYMPNAIVLIIDGLQAGFVGCYGNTWVDTPALNRLAAEGCCFDFAMADSVRIEALNRSYWTGSHLLAHDVFRPAQGAGLLGGGLQGVRRTLVSDAPEVFPPELVEPFDAHIVVPLPATAAPAASIDATHTAEFFTAAIEQVNQYEHDARASGSTGDSQLLWLHTRGLNGPWDAPLELREQLRDEEDPPPRDTADVPSWILPEDHDPDDLLQIVQAYAAQVMLIDHGIGWLLEALDRRPAADTLLIVAGARGFALGEHGWVGRADVALPGGLTRLHGELLHVPLLVRVPDQRAASVRNSSLVQPADIYATLSDWFGSASEVPALDHPASGVSLLPLAHDDRLAARQLTVAADLETNEFAARTNIWQLLQSVAGERLYVKPDDRWEVNDVADRAVEITTDLAEALAEFREAGNDPKAKLAPLAEDLITVAD